jgi:hypothetical protein
VEIPANDEVEDREGNKENESAKANKVSSSDEVQARAADKQTSKAVRRRSFENLGSFANPNTQPNLCRKIRQSISKPLAVGRLSWQRGDC